MANVKTKVSAKGIPAADNLDAFLQDLMSPDSGPKTQPVEEAQGDVDDFGSAAPADFYTASTLFSLLKSPVTQDYAKKVKGMDDYYRLLLADLLIGQAGSEEMRSQIESTISASIDSSSLEENLKKASKIFCKGLSEPEKQALKGRLMDLMSEGYLRKNRSTIETRLRRTYNEDTLLQKMVSKKANITKAIMGFAVAAALAVLGYQAFQSYQGQLDIQRQFGAYVEEHYNIQLPPSFYELFGGE